MTPLTIDDPLARSAAAAGAPKPKRPSTAHLKLVPETRELREKVRAEAERAARDLDRSRSLTRDQLQGLAQDLLAALGLGEQYLGFTMVSLSNEFWREQFMATDFRRRLLLLPHCLKHAEGCPADYDEFGLDCRKCGACSIADYKVTAEDLGYKVLVAEGTPIVLKIIVGGHVDAILGVACLNVLEKALDKVLKVGVPCLAVPLLSSNCKNTSVDTDWVNELIAVRTTPPQARTRTYLPLLRAANDLFVAPHLEQLAPPVRKAAANGQAAGDPLAATERLAFDWLEMGGKRFRPFITLASYDALQESSATLAATPEAPPPLPDAVRRVALAIETFHKASLVHDDIEDDDSFRYGRETLHRRHGVGVALNVGDYLIGLGYRLVSRERNALGGACAADILDRLADAHLKLAEGQGAELSWRAAAQKSLTPLEALKIYALKTSPAFEAALSVGLRLAGPAEQYEAMVAAFSRHLGVAFQILNDLKDWEEDDGNKLLAGGDVLGARPTLLLALALEAAKPAERAELLELLHQPGPAAAARVARVRRIFAGADVFRTAGKLVEKYRERAEAVADEVEPTALRELLYFLIDTVLEHGEPAGAPPGALLSLPVIAMVGNE